MAASASAKSDSLFSSGWGGSKPSFVPPKASLPSFSPPGSSPRTSDDAAVLSGLIDRPTEAKAEEPEEKAEEPEQAKAEEPEEKAEEPEAEPDEVDTEDEDEDEDEGEDEPKSKRSEPVVAAARAEGEGGSNGLLWVLAIAAAIVLVVIVVKRSGSEEPPAARTANSKPNQQSKQAKGDQAPTDRPKPRPPTTKTHAADPTLEALREKQAGEAGETGETGETAGSESETGEAAEGGSEAGPVVEPTPELSPTPAKVDDPRDPSLIPPGTPEENAKAFAKLPVSLNDGPPLGGIGRSGIHVDAISMGAGRDNSNCDDPTRSFTMDTEFVNVCLRVVHTRAEETLRVIWEKDGSVTRRSKLKIPEKLHAYTTRAYLQVRPEYVGSWRVRIVPEGEEDTDIAVAQFTIQ